MLAGDIVVGLDIGATKVVALIAEYDDAGELHFAGIGVTPSEGLKRGVIVNIEATQQAVVKAIEAAEQDAGRTVHEVYTAVTPGGMEGINSRGVLAISGRNGEVTPQDVTRVLETAAAVSLPLEREILQVVPQHYTVDGEEGIKDPLDRIGVRLEVDVHILTGSTAASESIMKCVSRGGYKLRDIAHKGALGARLFLSDAEKDLGTVFIDIGGGSCDVVVYIGGAPYYSSSLAIGGEQVTADLSIVLGIPQEQAERLKLEHGKCWLPSVNPEATVLLPGVGSQPPRSISEKELTQIIGSRMGELFQVVRTRLEKVGCMKYLKGGIVLAGGGSLLDGVGEMASEIFCRQARLSRVEGIKGLPEEYHSLQWGTVVALVSRDPQKEESRRSNSHSISAQGWDKLKEWFYNFI